MFRIYTEDIHESRIRRILHRYFPAYTLFRARGSWQGHSEPAAVIEVDTRKRKAVLQAAHDIKQANSQDAVMVTDTPERVRMI